MDRPEPMLRLFLALWPDAAVRAELVARRDAIEWPAGARPVAAERLHLTLHFIGAVPAQRLAQVREALVMPGARFVLRFDQLRPWPGGLVALLARDVPQPLRDLHAALATALRGLGLPVEARPFSPHVTLARRCTAVPALPAVEPLPWPADGHALVQSTPEGRYHVLQRYRFE